MNLGKLLNASTSIFGGGEPVSYHLNKGALPKFNVGRNPFASKPVETEVAVPEVQPPAVAEPRLDKEAGAPTQKAPSPYAFKPDQPEDDNTRRQAVAAPAAPSPAAKPAKQGWATRLNPFRAPEPARPPQAVQSELSLDAVKVVHNDLSDADVEVVPVKSHADAVAAPVLPPARRAWEYLGESLLNG